MQNIATKDRSNDSGRVKQGFSVTDFCFGQMLSTTIVLPDNGPFAMTVGTDKVSWDQGSCLMWKTKLGTVSLWEITLKRDAVPTVSAHVRHWENRQAPH